MFRVSTTKIIEITRGDSFSYPLYINRGTEMLPERYVIQDGDTVYLAVMEPNQKFEDAILKQVYDSSSNMTEEGDLLINLSSMETQYLKPGKYYYTIKIKLAPKENIDTIMYLPVQTIIDSREFWILD